MTVVLEVIRPKKYQLVDPQLVRSAVRRNMRQYLEEVKSILEYDYHLVPPGRTYIRTYNLQLGWEVHVYNDGASGALTNDTPYAVFVQGPRGGGRSEGQRQSQMQRSRGWQSITDIARTTRPRFIQLMNRSVKGSSAFYED